MSTNPRDIIIRPIVSEKSYANLDANVYTFEVASSANKIQIRQAVQDLFKVKVTKVNTLSVRGKLRRQRTAAEGTTPAWKKAIVTLKVGDKISLV